jgi:hypothetical protein
MSLETATAVLNRPALPEFSATVETMYDYQSGQDRFVIRQADGNLHQVSYGRVTGYPMYETRKDAQAFIDDGGLIAVELVDHEAVLAACGWDDEAGHCDANYDRFRAYCQAEGIHCYAAEKHKFFLSEGERQARKRGLRKLFAENLS